jgi:S1-C subfamily serine protease
MGERKSLNGGGEEELKRKLLIIALAVLASLTAVNVAALDVADHPWQESIVLIGDVVYGGMGGGFAITSDGYFATAAHVVSADSPGVVVVSARDGKMNYYRARVIYIDELHDVAIVKVDGVKEKFRPLYPASLAEMQIGDTLYNFGHPFGIGWVFSRGIFTAIKYGEDGYAYVMSDVSTAPGCSGSPILNERGEVVAILQQGINGVLCFGVAVDRFVDLAAAAIETDRKLSANRKELEARSDQAEAAWKELIKKIKEDLGEEESED